MQIGKIKKTHTKKIGNSKNRSERNCTIASLGSSSTNKAEM